MCENLEPKIDDPGKSCLPNGNKTIFRRQYCAAWGVGGSPPEPIPFGDFGTDNHLPTPPKTAASSREVWNL